VVDAQPTRRTWLAPGALARIAWRPGEHLYFEIEGGVLVPLSRERFYVDPSVTLYRQPAAGMSAGVGAGFVF
jgi:hypothetical protein